MLSHGVVCLFEGCRNRFQTGRKADMKIPMQILPQRKSLVAQTSMILRNGIMAGEWQGNMPGELELCRRLQVSRVTLRGALALLEKEGVVSVSQGRRRTIIGSSQLARQTSSVPTNVVLLSPVPHAQLTASKLLWIDELREQLAGNGLPLEFILSASAASVRPARVLQELTGRHADAAWVLLRSTFPMQRWFAEKRLPVVVAGSLFDGIDLPSVDTDYFSACRHAAGRLLARGASRLAILAPHQILAGDIESEAGFRKGAGQHPVTMIRHDGSPDGLCRALDSVMQDAAAPDGIIAFHSSHATTALGQLLRRGWALPDRVRLISRDDDPFLDHIVPKLARYSVSPEGYARQITRIILRHVSGDHPAGAKTLILPKFVVGETTG
jgi:DNA-binding LacI/PurR family transcriptional regulator/DNA-binding transcriptional regulator YhcF (GntR family)